MKRTNRKGITLATMLAFLMTALVSVSAFARGPAHTTTTTTVTKTKQNGKVVKKTTTVETKNRGLKKGHAKNGKAMKGKTVKQVTVVNRPAYHGPRVVERVVPLKRGRRVITTKTFHSGRVVTTIETFRRGRLIDSFTTTRFDSRRHNEPPVARRVVHHGGRV